MSQTLDSSQLTAEAKPSVVLIDLKYSSRVNYALQQNDIPFIQQLQIHNRTDQSLEDVTVEVRGEPGLVSAWEQRIQQVPPQSTFNLSSIALPFSPDFLRQIRERVSGLLHVTLTQNGETLASASFPFEALAFNEWSGIQSLPEILAAFVVPNHPRVEELTIQVRDGLQRKTGDASLSDYQSRDPERVGQYVAAVYETLIQQKISYITVPPSYETTGQKVRFPDQILHSRMGTCLDLTLLFADCLEHIGLHPLLVLIQGHALVGVWTVPECFPEACIDDPLRLRKRMELGQIVFLESTAITQSHSLERAHKDGSRHIWNSDIFHYAIDIKSARNQQIRPIPLFDAAAANSPQTGEAGTEKLKYAPTQATPFSRPVLFDSDDSHDSVGESDAGGLSQGILVPERVTKWKKKLLDLSLNNRLLNFKETKKAFFLLCPSLTALEDALSQGKSYPIYPRPKIMEGLDPRDAELYQRRTGNDLVMDFLREKMQTGILYSDLQADELERRLLETYREGRTNLEEGGANTLYLALGFLFWYESSSSNQPRMAPLILLPIELQRQSVREGFRFKMLDEEARINVTLLQKLEAEFGITLTGLDPLPTDEAGIDLSRVFDLFRKAVLEIPRWEIREWAFIGHFSFKKFLLWRDLEHNLPRLLENSVLRHMIERPDQSYQDGIGFPDPDSLDEKYPPQEVFCPVDADSSQLSAVLATAAGKTFVLEGPPGTGKSQTITNMISQCLAQGKRVLFVSEKMAALNVVHDRLSKQGLGPFCLELHSNKTDKRKVLNQLEQALNAYGGNGSGEWEDRGLELESLRKQLNRYVQLIGEKQALGESPFQGLSKLIGFRETPSVSLNWQRSSGVTREQRSQMRDAVAKLQTAAQAAQDVTQNPWRSVNVDDWYPDLQAFVEQRANRIREHLAQIHTCLRAIASDYMTAVEGHSRRDLETIVRLAELLLQPVRPTPEMIRETQWEILKLTLQVVIETGKRRDQTREQLFSQFQEEILELDLNNLQQWVQKSLQSYPPLSWFYTWKAGKELRKVCKQPKMPNRLERLGLVEQAIRVNQDQKALQQKGSDCQRWLGAAWNNGEADWETVANMLEWTEQFRSVRAWISEPNPENAQKIQERWNTLATDWRDRMTLESPQGKVLQSLCENFRSVDTLLVEMNEKLYVQTDIAWGEDSAAGYLDRVQSTLEGWLHNLPALHTWCAYVHTRNHARKQELNAVVAGLEEGKYSPESLPPVFEHSFYHWWVNQLIHEIPELRKFHSPEHARTIGRFKEMDREFLKGARDKVVNTLSQRIPNPTVPVADESEVGKLRREIKKKTRHMSVRKLCQELSHLLPRIKPCFLMSPLSVSQFLDSDFSPFDVVIFDEASQIPVWDSIGAIARGRQLVVVGDSKQLPPTNFFQKMDDADEVPDEDEIVELESILDESIAVGLPRYSLKWHYRSRHEHLIAFSNYHYYDNKLITFPAAIEKASHQGVRFCYNSDATYDHGKSRTNLKEAEALVRDVVARLRDPHLQKLSIGVVTLSMVQQRLIEDLLEKERRDHPEIDPFFSPDHPEPVIVKNLENIQGDERDVIYLSICYGPNAQGKFSMNFGPLNRTGGERRLNVAVTRARQLVMVYSSIRADQIDLSRTKAVGVQHLKTYLDYAERGPAAIAEATHYVSDADFDSPFEEEVWKALTARGWNVHKQVGCSGYRIDLAVCHPDRPGQYLLGIECDGACYHSTKVARDRDRLREAVLKGLGWSLHRIWSSDWWRDSNHEVVRLEAALEQAKIMADTLPPVVENELTQDAIEEEITKTPEESGEPENSIVSFTLPGMVTFSPYTDERTRGNGEDFYTTRYAASLRQHIVEIVVGEGPICFDRMGKLLIRGWGLKVLNQRVRDHLRRQIPQNEVHLTVEGKGEFLWSRNSQSEDYAQFRVPATDQRPVRTLEEISEIEMANAMYACLQQQINLPTDSLFSETTRLFGFRRLTTTMTGSLQGALHYLEKSGRCQIEGGQVKLK